MKRFKEHVEDVSLIPDEEECPDTKQADMTLSVGGRPPLLQWLFLGFQHVFAAFGTAILVSTLTGLPVSMTLFANSMGVLICTFVMEREVSVYLRSSFAYINAAVVAIKAVGDSVDAAQIGLILISMAYVVVVLIVRIIGKEWIDKLFPPIVIGPIIVVIGLGLTANVVSNVQPIKDGDPCTVIVAIVVFLIAALISTRAKGSPKTIPFSIAIPGDYMLSLCPGLINFQAAVNIEWLSLPDFILPSKIGNFRTCSLYFGPKAFTISSVALVAISEHIGDHAVLGKVCGHNFLKDPGLERTLMGDDIATAISVFLENPANTTYGENAGVIGMAEISSVYITGGAAYIVILLSCVGKIPVFISTILACVLGGMSILSYGVIASNGLRVLVDNRIDPGKQHSPVIASAMLVIGLGGAILPVGNFVTLSRTTSSALIGIILNLILPRASQYLRTTQYMKMGEFLQIPGVCLFLSWIRASRFSYLLYRYNVDYIIIRL